jgi:hypothetical protein
VDAAARLCAMNLFLHGIGGDTSPIRVADSLAARDSDNYYMVPTNPPFGKKSSITIINESGSGFFVDEIGDQAFELCRVLNLVLRLAKNGPEHAGLFVQDFERAPVMVFKRNAVELDQTGPVVIFRNDGLLMVRRLRALMRHFDEQEIRKRLDVIAVREAVIAEDIALFQSSLTRAEERWTWVGFLAQNLRKTKAFLLFFSNSAIVTAFLRISSAATCVE